MILTKVVISTTTECSDLVSNILIENGSEGTTIVDKNDVKNIQNEKGLWVDYIEADITKYYPPSVLVVGVINQKGHKDALKNIEKQLLKLSQQTSFNCGELTYRTEKVNDEHWVDIWVDFYKPITIGKFVIYANWQKTKKHLFKKPIILDPGAAFGTGQHPTTSMCIKLLQDIDLKNKFVLDIGCGSGILGIIAVKLGASSAYLTDIDPTACENAKTNAKLNNVSDKLTIKEENLVGDTSKKGDVVVANITSDVLITFSKNIHKNISSGGLIIISGIIDERAAEVEKVYNKAHFSTVKKLSENGWNAYLMKHEV